MITQQLDEKFREQSVDQAAEIVFTAMVFVQNPEENMIQRRIRHTFKIKIGLRAWGK